MKPASAKAKGRETENILAAWLSAWFRRRIERKRQTGAHDQGDLTGLPDWTMEVKSASGRLAESLDQARTEWNNTVPRPRWFVLFARRARLPKQPQAWYAVMPVWQWAAIALELERYRRAYGPAPDGYTHQDRT